MDQRVRDRVADWSERPVEGLDGVGALADEEFSGVVEHGGGAWFAMLNGSILGVHDGRIEEFEDGTAVARSAPEPGVALLMAMLAADATPEERYYTEDTPVSQAHETLSGGFAGYLELSENVLSGDYYVAYYGDHSAPVAFVGNSDRLVTGPEALQRADDEVGIYQVYAVDLEVVPVPGHDTPTSAGTAGAPAGATDGHPADGHPADADDTDAGTRRIEAPDTATGPDAGADDGLPADATTSTRLDADATDAEPEPRGTPVDADDDAARDGTTGDPAGLTGQRDPDPEPDPGTEYGSSTSYGTPPGGVSGPDTGADPGTDTDPSTDTGIDPDPGTDTGTDPRHGTDPDPSTDTSTDTGTDTGTDPGPGTDTGTGTGTDTGIDPDPSTDTGTGTGTDPEREFYSELDPDGDTDGDADDEPAASSDGASAPSVDPVTGDDRPGDAGPDPTEHTAGAADHAGPTTGDPPPDGQRDGDTTREPAGGEPGEAAGETAGRDAPATDAARPDGEHATGPPAEPSDDAPDRPDAGTSSAAPATEDLRARLDEHERHIEGLRERAASLAAADERAREAHEGLRAEVEEMAADLSDLRRTVMRLDRTVERLEAGDATAAADTDDDADTDDTVGSGPVDTDDDAGTEAGVRDMTPERALAETTLLLRYGSRGAPTLSAAHDDAGVERGAVEENLRVDVHTPFDDRTATVDGQPYRAFIEDRIEYRFFEWLVRDLLFEIRETGTQDALRDLYDALPSIDRAELRSTVVVADDGSEDGEEGVAFDVVVRDAHERPLVVARINASRDPATEEMVVGLRDSASRLGEDADLAAAVSVTESYFSGSARDAAEEATADSILSRNSKESYVKLSRKRGYHLCLVAVGSDEEFHLRVPDL